MSEFTVSFSTIERADACPRAHYHKCFTADRGWFESSPLEKRLAYSLKKMDGYYGWIGNTVHSLIEDYFREIIDHGKNLRIPTLLKKYISQMEKEWRESVNRSKRSVKDATWGEIPVSANKGVVHLIEHHLKDPKFMSDTMLREAQSRVEFLVQSFKSSSMRKFMESHPAILQGTAELEVLTSVEIAGVKVWVKADAILMDTDGTVLIPDWKTGKVGTAHEVQLGIYAKYMNHTFGVDPTDIECVDVYLSERDEKKQVVRYEISEKSVQMAEQYVKSGIARIGVYMQDIDRNLPKPMEKWPQGGKHADDNVCRWCQYKQICWKKEAFK